MSRKCKYTSEDSTVVIDVVGSKPRKCSSVETLVSHSTLSIRSGSLTVLSLVHPVNPPVRSSLELTTLAVATAEVDRITVDDAHPLT